MRYFPPSMILCDCADWEYRTYGNYNNSRCVNFLCLNCLNGEIHPLPPTEILGFKYYDHNTI